MTVQILSIGGTTLFYGNVFNSSSRVGNFVAEYLCGYLRINTPCNVQLNYCSERDSLDNILKNMSKEASLYIIPLDIVNFELSVKISKRIKQGSNYAKICVFGHLVTCNYREIIDNYPCFDFAVVGDAEEPIKRLLKFFNGNQIANFVDENIVVRGDSRTVRSAICKDINRMPCFDFYEKYSQSDNRRRTHCISIKNNTCMGSCSFCWSRKGLILYKDAKRIIDEIDYVSKTFSVKDFYFTDNDIFDINCETTTQLLKDVFNGILNLKRNLTFFAFAKAKNISKEKLPLLNLMKQAGLYCLFIGIDAGNESDRILYNKMSTLNESKNALAILKSIGMWYRIGFIAVNPYSSMETLRENFLFLNDIGSPNYYHYGGLRVMVFKGTSLYRKLLDDDLLTSDFSFLNVYAYKYQHEEIITYLNFIYDELLPVIKEYDEVPFMALKRMYELTNKIYDLSEYSQFMSSYETNEVVLINKYFSHLFLNNDIAYCRKNRNYFVDSICNLSYNNKKLIEQFEKIYNQVPVIREDE